MDLVYETFIRQPFVVQAVRITEENIEAIAKILGAKDDPEGGLRTAQDGIRFIAIDRRVVPNMSRAYLGWYMTILAENHRVYSPKAFAEQFMDPSELMAFAIDFDVNAGDHADPNGIERPEVDEYVGEVVEENPHPVGSVRNPIDPNA